MTVDQIKALVERLQKYCGTLAPPIARSLTYEAHRALTALLEENTRLRLEFRADCEKQAEELYAMQRALTDIANADTIAWDDPTEFEAWAKSRARHALAQTDKAKP